MPIRKISKEFNKEVYFLTFTIFRWYYLFDRYQRWNILADSLNYCRNHKGLKLYEFVFMLNHIHLIIQSTDVIAFVRDFKKFTSKEFKKNILGTETHILKLFVNKKGQYQFWQRTNMPIILESDWIYEQKRDYIHENPVAKDYVNSSEDWYWSSANEYCELKPDEVF